MMSTISSQTIDAIATHMGGSFLEDPMNRAQLEGIKQKEKLMRAHARLHIHYALKTGALHLLDNDPKAVMVALDSNNNSKFREIQTMVKTIGISLFILEFREVKQLLRNMKLMSKVLNFSWHRDFIQSRHYRVKIISIDKSLRGTGAFRRLFTPAIAFADKEKIPMVLETHNPSNVGLYQHFGFELVKTITSPDTPVQQYCMIRKPVKS